MKKNLYYHITFRRTNAVKMFVLGFFLGIASWPRLLLEVFLRKNFGERYFSFSTAIILTLFLAATPIVIHETLDDLGQSPNIALFIAKNITWYLFLAGFIYMANKRRLEVLREPSVFDFARFSLSTGQVDPRFYNIKMSGKQANHRIISTLLEPGICLGAGVLLMLFQQAVGIIIVACSIIYSLSYLGAYYMGDQFVMDKIDELICNEELVNSFVDDVPENETRGFQVLGRKPTNREFRRKLADSFIEETEAVEVY